MTTKKKVLLITIPSVIVAAVATVIIVTVVKDKNKNQVNESEWKTAYNSIFNFNNRNFTCYDDADQRQPFIKVKNVQELYDPYNGSSQEYLQYKYKKGNDVYFYCTSQGYTQWTKVDQKMFSESVFGLKYVVGIDSHYKDFSFNNDKYTGTNNNAKLEIKFNNEKNIESIMYTVDSVSATMHFSFGNVEFDNFPTPLP